MGIYERSTSFDAEVFRYSVVDLVADTRRTVVRYFAENLVSGHNWEESVVPEDHCHRWLDGPSEQPDEGSQVTDLSLRGDQVAVAFRLSIHQKDHAE